jgi:hypothetical protein
MPGSREQWFADVLRAGLDTRLLAEQDVLSHATPAVLIKALPKDVLVGMFDAALTSGTISPKAVVQAAPPDVLARHVPPPVLWGCIAAAAERAGITSEAGKASDDGAARDFLRRALEAGVKAAMLGADQIVKHVNASVIGLFPDELTTKLLETSLAAGKMNAALVVDTLGIDAIARHAPTKVLWACLDGAGAHAEAPVPERHPPPPPKGGKGKGKPSLDIVEDDIASVLVDLDDSIPMKPLS